MEEISQNVDIDFIKTRAYIARHSYIENMENKLAAFEKRMLNKNFNVFWADNEASLVELVYQLLPEKIYNKVCFDLPHIPEEFNNAKRIKKIPIVEVENGKQSASVLFTQADFGILETGTLVLLNKRSKNCFNLIPNIFILLDINKLIDKTSDLELLLYLKSYSQNQEFLPEDVKIINRPIKRVVKTKIQQEGEFNMQDVPITIFLYDNGITEILKDNILRTSLYCIDCGRCRSVCPIYQYEKSKEFSPIELVKANCFAKNRLTGELFSRTLLCGNCTPVCPVQIPITDLLIREMELSKKQILSSTAKTFLRRKKLNKMSKPFQRYFFLRKLYGKNKMLFSYFKQQPSTFFNIKWLQEHPEDE